MKTKIETVLKFKELNLDELKSLNGGEPTKATSFYYDAVYTVTYLITKSEIFTRKFWEDWGYAIL